MTKNICREELVGSYSELGLKVLDDNSILNSSNKEICNFIPYVTGQKKIDGKNYLCISGLGIDNEQLLEIILDSNSLQKNTWVSDNFGFQYFIDKKLINDFLKIIQKSCRYCETKSVYNHTGWIKENNEWGYLHAGGCIGELNVDINLDDSINNYKLPEKIDDLNIACNMSLKLVDMIKEDKGIILQSLVYLSPLVGIINQKIKPPENVIWLWGKTGSRKTSVAKAYLSHYGNFKTKIPSTFNDTNTAIEIKANLLKDTIYLCDDFAPKQEYREQKNQDTKAEFILRMYGDRIAKGRSSNKLDIKNTNVPRGMALITGENIITGESSNARLISIEVNRESVNLDILTEVQNNSSLLGESMRGYIEWIIEELKDEESFLDTLIYNFESFRTELREKYSDIHGRTIDSCSWIMLGFYCMLGYMLDKEVINDIQQRHYLIRLKNVIDTLIEDQIKLISSNSPIDIFLNTLKEAINSKSIRVGTLNEQNQVIEDKLEYICGYRDKKYYYFYTDKVYGLIRREQQKQGVHMGITQRELVKQLRDENLVKVDSNNDSPKKVIYERDLNEESGYRQIRPRMLQFDRSIIDNFKI
ncbi:TPA: hypothetical protein KQF34_003066 [Clostridioides difficile]|nr:hypothetical protein [Clostridioides difficile]